MAPLRFQPTRIALATAAALAICLVGPAGYAAPPSVTPATDAKPIDPTQAAAPMQAIFGAAWRPDDGAALIHIDEGADAGWWHLTPLASKRLPDGRTMLIVNGAPRGEDGSSSPARADGGMLNLYVLRQTQSAWQVLERHEDVAKMGSLGMIGTVRWLDLGAGKQGIVISSGEAAVGSRAGVADIYELDHGLRHLGSFAEMSSNEGACTLESEDCWTVEGKIGTVPALRGQAYLDIVVDFTGRHSLLKLHPDGTGAEHRARTIRQRARYRFDGTRYVLAAGQNPIPDR
jgi:hypothetical protein